MDVIHVDYYSLSAGRRTSVVAWIISSVSKQWYPFTTMMYFESVPETLIFCQREFSIASNVHQEDKKKDIRICGFPKSY